jgi:sterol desaturase/sphingolipid hydroxylase (fatty acid hydroxylase superfamily)/uncharacterized membrane protein YhhN
MNVIVFAIPVFLLAIAVEYAASVWMGRRIYRLNDAVNSLSLGILSQISGVFTKLLTIGIYSALFSEVALWTLPANDWKVWLFALLAYDFCYYWNHRLGHVCSVFWAAHVVHHQSEDYNLTTALRQTSSGALLSWLFYVPLAVLGVPPLVFAIAGLIDLLYQFWIHTELVGKLGWFDRVFASPSNHRVHHAVNRKYLDRNYGGILIIWDRLFGTFIEEDEPVVYGTRPRLASWDPVWANFELYWELARRSWLTRNWRDKLRVWIAPPGWRPDDLKDEKRAPQLPRGAKRYDPPAGPAALAFAIVTLAGGIAATAAFLWNAEQMALGPALVGAGAISAALWAGGAAMQSRLTIAEAVFLVVAAAACAASAYGAAALFAVLKPAATALAVAAVALRTAPIVPKALTLAALIASLAGDALLMRADLFVFGLAAFLVAHLIYIALIARDAAPRRSWGASALVALYGVAMLVYLWPQIDAGLKAPVAAYVAAISTMLALAISRALALQTRAAILVALGALAFVVSDSALALTLFAGGGEALKLLVLPTYWLAQALISFNVLPRGEPAPAPVGELAPAGGSVQSG